MKPESVQILIEKYLLGTLSSEEQDHFNAIKMKPEFQKQLAEQQDLMHAIKSSGRDALKTEMKGWEKGIGFHSSQHRRRRRLMWGGLAAALIALLFLLFEPSSQNEKLFAEHFQPYENVLMVVLRGADTAKNPAIRGFSHYEGEAYSEALSIFDQVLDTAQDLGLEFYRANCLMQLGETKDAIASLQKVRNDPSAKFYPHSAWYLALAYLKSDQTDSAKSLLKEVANNAQNPFQIQAKKLLDSMG